MGLVIKIRWDDRLRPYFRFPIGMWISRAGLFIGTIGSGCGLLIALGATLSFPQAVSNVIAIAALAMFALFLLDGIQATVKVIGRRRKGSRDGEKDGFSDWSPNR